MLTVRHTQIEALRHSAAQQFEEDLVRHLHEFAPAHCEVIGDVGVRATIRLGVERAAGYGFRARGPVRFYVELMFMFGSDFDTDPQLPWAAIVLTDPLIHDQMNRANRLYEEMRSYLTVVAGRDYEYAKEALRRTSRERFEQVVPEEHIVDIAMARLKGIHPQKCSYLGEQGLRTVIAIGRQRAHEHGARRGNEIGLFVGLAFALGHGFAADPLYPWIKSTLSNEAIPDQQRRIERLASKSHTYLEHVLRRLDA